MSIRRASHAGGWYPNTPSKLTEDLDHWLDEVELNDGPARAIIVPHAAYQYSGLCAASAYKRIDSSLVKRVFILGPSHYKPFKLCALTRVSKYETPLYNIEVDVEVIAELEAAAAFEKMDLVVDEQEHSIEMQLPFIAKVMEGYADQFKIVPILVGSLPTVDHEKHFGKILSKYLAEPDNLFVISSDFCHWGKKFNYTPFENGSDRAIYQYIEELDRMGMNLIENLDSDGFHNYLKKYNNTICGKNPIFILLHAVNRLKNKGSANATLNFLNYTQSNHCLTFKDTSVSYASACLTLE